MLRQGTAMQLPGNQEAMRMPEIQVMRLLIVQTQPMQLQEILNTDQGNADRGNAASGNTDQDNVAAGDTAASSETGSAESGVGLQDDTTAQAAEAENYVPELDPLNMDAMLSSNTDVYFFHADENEEVPADSTEITDWQQVQDDTNLEMTDIVKIYLAYSIPAGSLNETNPTARYRLPENIHLTDDQIKAINKNVNGIADILCWESL